MVASGAGRTMIPGGAEGVRIQGEADWSMGRGGVMGLEARGRARESSHHGRASAREAQGVTASLGRVNGGGGAKELNRTSRVNCAELGGLLGIGGNGRLCGTTSDEEELKLV